MNEYSSVIKNAIKDFNTNYEAYLKTRKDHRDSLLYQYTLRSDKNSEESQRYYAEFLIADCNVTALSNTKLFRLIEVLEIYRNDPINSGCGLKAREIRRLLREKITKLKKKLIDD